MEAGCALHATQQDELLHLERSAVLSAEGRNACDLASALCPISKPGMF